VRLPALLPFLAVIPTLSAAQPAAIGPRPSRVFAVAATPALPADTLPEVGDHRVAGSVVGGLAGGAIGYLFARAALYEEADPDSWYGTDSGPDDGEVLVTSLVTLGSVAVGAWVGHKVGRASPTIPDHRVTGAVMGGVLGGAIGLFAGQGGGDQTAYQASPGDGVEVTPTTAFATVAGAAIGAGIGYFMGRSTPKGSYPDVPPQAPLPKDTGLTPAQGAGLGAALGAVALTFLALDSQGADGVPVGFVAIPFGALVGAFVGYGVTRE